MEMAKIGATPKGGVNRLTLTDLDRESRDLFAKWGAEAGCTLSVDQMGSMFLRRPGTDDTLPPERSLPSRPLMTKPPSPTETCSRWTPAVDARCCSKWIRSDTGSSSPFAPRARA